MKYNPFQTKANIIKELIPNKMIKALRELQTMLNGTRYFYIIYIYTKTTQKHTDGLK